MNGGVCKTDTTPPHCECPETHAGVDCSIPLDIFPTSCNLVALWPLTTNHLDGNGNLINLNVSSDVATFDRTVLYFPDGGPQSVPEGSGFGIPLFTPGVANGGITVEFTKIAPFQIDASFTISAYVRFTSNWNWDATTKWPFVSFEDDGVAGHSPLIWLNPDGEMIIEYTSLGATVVENLNALPIYVGKGHSWKFVSIQYDSFISEVKHTVIDFLDNTTTFSAAITLVNKPNFNTKKMFIGSDGGTDNFDGYMACFSIYNWALSATEIEQLKMACDHVLGGATAPAATPGCDGCTSWAFPNLDALAMPDTNEYLYNVGDTVTFTSAMFTQFGTGHPERERTVVCNGTTGQWDDWEDPQDYSHGCNPGCLNNGICVCNDTVCACQCNPLFTGNDCSWIVATHHEYMFSNSSAFWPLDAQRVVSIDGVKKALDLSQHAQHLDIGKTVALVDGPFGVPKTAVRFRNSIVYDKFIAALHGTVSNTLMVSGQVATIHFYMKYNADTGHQTVFGFETPSGGPQSSSLGLNETSGCFNFNPGPYQLPCGGNLNDMSWIGVKMMYHSPLAPNTIESSGAADPLVGNGPVVTLQTSTNFLIGMDNFLALSSDLTISCLGIYNDPYTASDLTAIRHRRLCSQVHKYHCPAAPLAGASMVGPRYATAGIDSSVFYFCLETRQVSSSRIVELQCADSAGTIIFTPPGPNWVPAAPAACTTPGAGVCTPGCVHGTCNVNLCDCDPGWGGVDCDIDLTIFPENCRKPYIYPLTSKFVANSGKSKNLFYPDLYSISNPTGVNADWQAGDLYSTWPPEFGINNYAYALPTTHSVDFSYKVPPFQSATSFTISAYVKFDITNANYDVLYPVVTFKNEWVAPSPALYLAPNGNAMMIYKYGTVNYTLSLSLPTFVGIGPWAFVSYVYNSTVDEVQVVLNAENYSLPISTGVTPQFHTIRMYLGSSDTAVDGASDVFAGQIACLSLYNTALNSKEITDLMLACNSLLGGPAISSSENVTQCRSCYQLPLVNTGGSEHIRAFPTISDVDFPVGTTVPLKVPPYRSWDGDYLTVYRTLDVTCTTNNVSEPTWEPAVLPDLLTSLYYFFTRVCDPSCINGRCLCIPICLCICFPGYTGADCQMMSTPYTATPHIFVPLTSDTGVQEGTKMFVRALDFGTYGITKSYEWVLNGMICGFEEGPFGVKDTGYRQRSIRDSMGAGNLYPINYISAPGPDIVFVPNWEIADWTMMVFIKYDRKQIGHENIVSFYYAIGTYREFALSTETGEILIYPDDLALPLNASETPIEVAGTWVPIVITYNAGLLNAIYGDATVNVSTGMPYVFPTGIGVAVDSRLNFLYSNVFSKLSDLSIACFGLYIESYSYELTVEHAKRCQMFSKQKCPTVPMPEGSNFFMTDQTTIAGSIVTFSCFEGYWWNSTQTKSIELLCDQSNSTMPSLFWNAPDLPAYCTSKFISRQKRLTN